MLSTLTEKSVFDLAKVTTKKANIALPETITDAIEQPSGVTKVLAFDNTPSIGIYFSGDFTEVPENKH